MIHFELIFECIMKGLNLSFPCGYLIVPALFVKKMVCVIVDSAFIRFVPLKKGEVGRG